MDYKKKNHYVCQKDDQKKHLSRPTRYENVRWSNNMYDVYKLKFVLSKLLNSGGKHNVRWRAPLFSML